MNGDETCGLDPVDRAFSSLREAALPDGPSQKCLAAVLEAGRTVDGSRRLTVSDDRKRRTSHFAGVAFAAAMLVTVLVGVWMLVRTGNDGVALADVREQIRRTDTYRYTALGTERLSDGKTEWLRTTKFEHFFKKPGLNRRVYYDEADQVRAIELNDYVNGNTLYLDVRNRWAGRTEKGHASPRTAELMRSGDNWLTDIETWDRSAAVSLGVRDDKGRKLQGYRHRFADTGNSADIWVDVLTKRVVLFRTPGRDEYDPDGDPAAGNSAGGEPISQKSCCLLIQDIVYEPALDDSLFSFDIPDGYELTTTKWDEPGELEVIQWFRVLAGFYGGTLPEWDVTEYSPIPVDDINGRILKKKRAELTESERKILRAVDSMDGHSNPIRRFAEFTAGDSWHYQGQNVRLGDADRILCWYRKDEATFRVFFGDLQVRDVRSEDMPELQNRDSKR